MSGFRQRSHHRPGGTVSVGRLWLGTSFVVAGATLAVMGAPTLIASVESGEAERPAEGVPAVDMAQLDKGQRAIVERTAVAVADVPGQAQVVQIEPSFDDAGQLVGGVATVRFPPFSGRMQLPGERIYERNGERRTFVDQFAYDVQDVDTILVAVHLDDERIQWAAPDTGSPESAEEAPGKSAAAPGRIIAASVVGTRDRSGVPADPQKDGWLLVTAEEGE